MNHAGRCAIGIDLGGTNLRVVLADDQGRRLAEHFGPTPASAAAADVLAHIALLARRVQGGARPIGVGLGVAGALDAEDRLMAGMTNLPALAGVPLAASLGQALGLPVRIDNDARAAMLGEARFGAARGVRNALILTLGTGIGGGLLLDGRVREGPHRMAGEICLTLVPSAIAAGWQPLEDVASPGGLRRTRGIDMAALMQRVAAGEPGPQAELDKITEPLAVAIVNMHATLDFELVLLSGGLTRAGPALLAAVGDAVQRVCPPAIARHLSIAYAGLGEWAGAMGAAALWLAPEPQTDPARTRFTETP
jgi:glucokinase